METQEVRYVDSHGMQYYSDKEMTILHRLDGPAVEYPNGTKFWYVNGQRHRIDGPAVEYADGRTKFWFLDGKRHRLDGPAAEYSDGSKSWYSGGKLHRLDGPALERSNGDKEWYVDGQRHRLDGPAIEYSNGDKEWFVDNKLHRLDGPAIEYSNGDKECFNGITEWVVDGKRLTEEEFIALTSPNLVEPTPNQIAEEFVISVEKSNMKRQRVIDDIVIDNKMYANRDWRAYVRCIDENGIKWELRAHYSETPEGAIANAMEAFNCEDWADYGIKTEN